MDMENMLFDLNKTDKRLYKEIYDESRQCVANINAVSFGGWADERYVELFVMGIEYACEGGTHSYRPFNIISEIDRLQDGMRDADIWRDALRARNEVAHALNQQDVYGKFTEYEYAELFWRGYIYGKRYKL